MSLAGKEIELEGLEEQEVQAILKELKEYEYDQKIQNYLFLLDGEGGYEKSPFTLVYLNMYKNIRKEHKAVFLQTLFAHVKSSPAVKDKASPEAN